MSKTVLSALLAVASFVVPALGHAASPLAVALVREQFEGALIVPDLLPTFEPTGIFLANYTTTFGRVNTGFASSAANVSAAPEIAVKGTEADEAVTTSPYYEGNNATVKFTVLLIDANYPGSDNPDGYNIHYLANGLSIVEDRDHWLFLASDGDAVIPYAGPAPAPGSGPHRYVFLAYVEPASFTAPATPAPNSGVQLIDLAAYVSAAGLGAPLTGNYFTVETGTATVQVESTTSVDSTTLPEYVPPTASGSSSAPATSTGATAAGFKLTVAPLAWLLSVALSYMML